MAAEVDDLGRDDRELAAAGLLDDGLDGAFHVVAIAALALGEGLRVAVPLLGADLARDVDQAAMAFAEQLLVFAARRTFEVVHGATLALAGVASSVESHVPAADDHYAVLEVAPDADLPAIRRAWVRAARASHPDGQAEAADDVGDAAEDRIRSVNEAWRVLGDDKLRREYDRLRRRSRPQPAVAHPVADDGIHLDPRLEFDIDVEGRDPQGFAVRSAGLASLLRTLPWLIAGGLGVGIFVFTAFASSSRSQNEAATGPSAPECVRIRADGTVQPVPCQWDNDGVIDQFIPLDSDQVCRHREAMPHDAPRHNARLCLVPYEVFAPPG